MGIPYDGTIPSVGGDPNIQYNTIRSNFASVQTFVDVDHVDFTGSIIGANTYGQHKQVTLNNVTSPSAPTNPTSILYTQVGVASPISDLTFKNQNGTFVLDLIRAYVVFDGNGNILNSQSMNVTSVTLFSAGIVTIVFNPTAVIGTSFAIIATTNSASASSLIGYTITGANTVRVSYGIATRISLIALQI